jgi:golgin subfamily B member 1
MDITQRIKSRLTQVTDWASIVDQLEAEAASLDGGPAQSAATFELARAAEDVILDKARAMPLYQKAFKLDQTNLLALQHAREIYQEMASLDMVTRLMGLELRANQDPSRAVALNYAYGTATLNQRNIDTAKGFLEAAVTAAPDDKRAAARLAEVRYDRANWEAELASRLAEVSALVGGDALAADVQRAGWDTSCAYMRCARILQQENPADPRVLPLVFKALDADPHNEEAGFIAELVLAAGGHLQHIQKLMDRRANLVERPAARLELLLHFASVWQVRLNNPQMSAYFYRQALELAYGEGFFGPWHLAAYRAVKRQAQESGQAEGIVELADKALAAMSDPVDRAILALEAGELAWQANKDVDTARRLLVIANQAAPDHPTVQSFTAQLGLGSPAPDATSAPEAVDAGAAAEAAAEAEARAAAEAEARAAAEAEAAGRAAADAQARAEAEAAAAEQAAAAAAAKAEADARKREEDEARRAADEARKAEEREKAAAAKAAAEAAKAAAEAASLEPVDPSDLGDESFTEDELVIVQKAMAEEKKGGKKALDAWRDAMAKLPEKRLPVERLRAIYVAEGKWSNVADLYKEMIKRASDDAAREPLYWELINLYRDQLKQPGLVVTTLSQLEKLCEGLEDNEKLLRVVEAQQQQFDEMKRWPDLIGRIRRRAELTQDPVGRTALQLEAGNLFLEKFNNQAEAIKSFEAVLEDDPLNGDALTKLEDLYGRRRDWEKMISVQQKRLQLLDDPSQQLEQLLEVARNAAAKVKKNALSIELWSAVRDLDPTNAEALEALEALLEKEKDWEGLAKTLETLCEITDDTARKSQSLVKLGLLYSDKLERNADAIRVWEALYELEPDNRRAQDALKKLYLQEGRMDALQEFYAKQDKWGEFVRVLEKESETAEGEARTTLLLKIAELYRTHLAKPDRAIKALEKALSHDTNNLVVAETLIELYEQEGDERNLSVPLRIKLAHTEDPEARQTLLARLGDLADRVLGEKPAAFGYFKQALAEDHARSETAEAMRRLGEEQAHGPSSSTPSRPRVKSTAATARDSRCD